MSVPSDGILVDHTPPEMVDLGPATKSLFQQQNDSLQFDLKFSDSESGIYQYMYAVYELYHGQDIKFWPTLNRYEIIHPNVTALLTAEVQLRGLSLKNGATYRLQVNVVNRAKLSVSAESAGITVDTSPPRIPQVGIIRTSYLLYNFKFKVCGMVILMTWEQ